MASSNEGERRESKGGWGGGGGEKERERERERETHTHTHTHTHTPHTHTHTHYMLCSYIKKPKVQRVECLQTARVRGGRQRWREEREVEVEEEKEEDGGGVRMRLRERGRGMYTQYPRLQSTVCPAFIHKKPKGCREWSVDRQPGREKETERERRRRRRSRIMCRRGEGEIKGREEGGMYTQYPRLQSAVCRVFIHKTQRCREWTVLTDRQGERVRQRGRRTRRRSRSNCRRGGGGGGGGGEIKGGRKGEGDVHPISKTAKSNMSFVHT